MRIEPPPSVPSDSGASPAATAAALPPDDLFGSLTPVADAGERFLGFVPYDLGVTLIHPNYRSGLKAILAADAKYSDQES